jgi:hypothetical protein
MSKYFFLVVIISMSFIGCEKSMTESSGGGTGTVNGFFKVMGLDGWPAFDNRGIYVRLLGTNYQDTTDSLGNWTFKDIPAGVYSLEYSKEGYVSQTYQNVTVYRNSVSYYENPHMRFYLHLEPNLLSCKDIITAPFKDEVLIIEYDSTYFDPAKNHDTTVHKKKNVITPNEIALFSVTISVPQISERYSTISLPALCHLFFSRSELINPNDTSHESGISFHTTRSIRENRSQALTISVRRSELLKAGYHSGDIIYCSAHAMTEELREYQWDPQERIYQRGPFSIHHSQPVSFILP